MRVGIMPISLKPTLSEVISQVRVKLRDTASGGIATRYTDGDLALQIANATSSLYRKQKSAFWGIEFNAVNVAINRMNLLNNVVTLEDDDMNGGLPMPFNYEWMSKVVNDATLQAETVQQQGVRPGANLVVSQEEA